MPVSMTGSIAVTCTETVAVSMIPTFSAEVPVTGYRTMVNLVLFGREPLPAESVAVIVRV